MPRVNDAVVTARCCAWQAQPAAACVLRPGKNINTSFVLLVGLSSQSCCCGAALDHCTCVGGSHYHDIMAGRGTRHRFWTLMQGSHRQCACEVHAGAILRGVKVNAAYFLHTFRGRSHPSEYTRPAQNHHFQARLSASADAGTTWGVV